MRQVSANEMKDKEGQPETKWEAVDVIGDPPKWKKLLELAGLMKIKREHGISILMNSFIDSILFDKEPIVSGESTLSSIELVNAIILSAYKKKAVDLPLDKDEYDNLFNDLSTGKKELLNANFTLS